ncbi:MAG: NAD(P)-dependent alcohol dehydrogenase [Rhodobacterales bacterium]|nr:NAD(P)-dependent alcohol dehydrogenase [Rhodobacterales bacterium]
MRVWSLERAFGLDNLELVDRPAIEPGPGQVAVAMTAMSLNFRDLVIVTGGYGPSLKAPLIPLSDGVGVVEAVGPGVSRVAVGDRVCPLFFQNWLAGAPPHDLFRGTLGGPLNGVLAERRVLSADGVAKVPDHLSDAEAACLPCAGLTAWSAIVTEGRVAPGQTVLVQGTGGVALFALQFAKLTGARVIVTSSSDEKLERARALGADETINYRTDPEWDRTAKTLTGGEGIDHVVEVGGAGTLDRALNAVRVGGTVSLIGVLSGGKAEVTLQKILMRQVRVQGITVGSRDGFDAMARALAQGGLHPVVDRTFGFDDVKAAFDHLKSGAHFGKVTVGV